MLVEEKFPHEISIFPFQNHCEWLPILYLWHDTIVLVLQKTSIKDQAMYVKMLLNQNNNMIIKISVSELWLLHICININKTHMLSIILPVESESNMKSKVSICQT